MSEYEDHIDVYEGMGPTTEHYLDCPNRHYSYGFSYGYTTISVGDEEFGWAYSDDRATMEAQQAAADAAVQNYRNLGHGSNSPSIG
jgi:hypothetical protein